MHVSKTCVYQLERASSCVLESRLKKVNAKFPTSAQAIQFAKEKFNDEPFDEVLIEKCGTKASFCLMKFSNMKNAYLIIND